MSHGMMRKGVAEPPPCWASERKRKGRGLGGLVAAAIAAALTGAAAGQTPCEPHEGVGCDDPACQAVVCELWPSCCEAEWDVVCASLAGYVCEACGGGPLPEGLFCGGEGEPCCFGSDDLCDAGLSCAGICLPICDIDPCLCNPCAAGCGGECNPICPQFDPCACGGIACGCPTAGDCCQANGTPGCVDPFCCDLVCSSDPFCCDTAWDGICADAAQDSCVLCDPCIANPCGPTCNPECNVLCPQFDACKCAGVTCGCPTAGLCCEANGTPGCIDPVCCDLVCSNDPFCCDTSWDGICAGQAIESCALCEPCILDPCGPTCSPECNPLCPQFDPCACSPGPCNPDCPEFDECACVGLTCGCPTAGSCCQPNGTPGCAEPFCCELVCSSDPFCCDTAWDQSCADAANQECLTCGAFCGGEGEVPCICEAGLCCGGDLAPAPPFGLCSLCAPANPGYFCNLDGEGQAGEAAWQLFSTEHLRTDRTADRGLAEQDGQVVNAGRFQPDVTAFTATWASRALALQRTLTEHLPVTQSQFVGSHNSFATKLDLLHLPLYQHSYSISDQLRMGVRWIGLDAHWSDDAWLGGPLKDLRLSHAQPTHIGMTPFDRPFRHGIEEIALWLDANPDEVVFVNLQIETEQGGVNNADAAAQLLPPIEDYLGTRVFRPSDRDGAGWATLSADDVRAAGRQIVFFALNDGVTLLPQGQDLVHPHLPTRPRYSGDGANGIKAALDPANGYLYNPATQASGLASHPTVLSAFMGDPSAWSAQGFAAICADACDAVCSFADPIFDDACAECLSACGAANVEAFDGPEDFGITTPGALPLLYGAGVNMVELCPIGESSAGVTGGYALITEPFEPLLTACVWSWATDEPEVSGQAKAARATFVAPGVLRFESVHPGTPHRFAAQTGDGGCWTVTAFPAPFFAGQDKVDQEFPGALFAAPANGLMMSRLATAMTAAGVDQVWVNYHDMDGDNQWVSSTMPEQAPMPSVHGVALTQPEQRITVPGMLGFTSAGASVMMWVRTSDTTKAGALFSYAVPGQANEFLVANQNNLEVWVNGQQALVSGVSIADGRWHHVAATWALGNGHTALYIDGELVATGAGGAGNPIGNLGTIVLGDDQDCVNGCFQPEQAFIGEYDEVRIWNFPLPQSIIIDEMLAITDLGLTGSPIAAWSFDEGVGTAAADAFPGGALNAALLINGASWTDPVVCQPPPSPAAPADLDRDGDVDSGDLNLLLAEFGCTSGCEADIDDDGDVDSGDLNALLGAFGEGV